MSPLNLGQMQQSTAEYIRLLLSTYFPQEQWYNAWCIVQAEPSGQLLPAVNPVGQMSCIANSPVHDTKAWGIFGLLDVCWDPNLNPASPFTPAQWQQVLDPNVNAWMASVIWNRYGWDAWTTAAQCGLSRVQGGAIPHPEGIVAGLTTVPPPSSEPQATSSMGTWLLIGGVAVVTLGGLIALSRR